MIDPVVQMSSSPNIYCNEESGENSAWLCSQWGAKQTWPTTICLYKREEHRRQFLYVLHILICIQYYKHAYFNRKAALL